MADTSPPRIQTFVVFDLEATGLPGHSADYPVRIMEISMVAIQREGAAVSTAQSSPGAPEAAAAVQLATLPPAERGLTTPTRKRPVFQDAACATPERAGARRRLAEPGTPREASPAPLYSPVPTPPRVRNSLLLTVNPCKHIPPEVADLTGLDNDLLEDMAGFDASLSELLRAYIDRLPGPVCLVAHNGSRYDFPLLQAELKRVGATWPDEQDVLCVDSLAFFRQQASAAAAAEPADGQLDSDVYVLDNTTMCCSHAQMQDACVVCNPALFVPADECDTNAEYEMTRVAGKRAIRCQHVERRQCVVCEHVPVFRRLASAPAARRALFPASGAKPAGKRGPSMRLPDLFERRFGVPPERSHCAADDVDALLLLCLSHGDAFFAWADGNSARLAGVREMWTRRRAGGQPAA